MRIREASPTEYPALHRLFADTVRAANVRDYTPAQVEAWAPREVDMAAWEASFAGHRTLVAVEGDAVVGFGDIAPDGYLDRLFVHPGYQRQGIATALCDALEVAVERSGERVSAVAAGPLDWLSVAG